MDSNKNIKRKLLNVSKTTGKGSIYIYYSIGGKEKKFPTGIKLHPDKWDKKKSTYRRGSLSDTDSLIVENLYNTLVSLIIKYQIEYPSQLPPIEYLENGLTKPEEKREDSVLVLMGEWIERNKRISSETKKNHSIALKSLTEFCEHINYNLTLENFDFDFIERYNNYQLEENKIQSSTLKLRIQVFKTFTNWLNKRDIKHKIKYINWEKIKTEKPDLVCLERNELDDLLAYKPQTKNEQRVKDTLVFLSHTGVRHGDLEYITKDCIINKCIVFYPHKTKGKNIKVVIPISKPVREILERYDYKLPLIKRSNLTIYIKNLCENIESLKKEIMYNGKLVPKYSILSTHNCGRKTFINLCVQNAVPIPIIMGFTGHTKVETFIGYVDKHLNGLPQLNKVFEFDKEDE